MSLAVTGMVAGGLIGLFRNRVDPFATGNPTRIVFLGVAAALCAGPLGVTIWNMSLSELQSIEVLLALIAGLGVGALPVAFALNSVRN
jgi:hypothetical protein